MPLVQAADWRLKAMGMGIYIYDQAKYHKELQIVEKRNTWLRREPRARNAFCRSGARVFGAWLVGPLFARAEKHGAGRTARLQRIQ
ncbi:MAG TPA: hypothetical protein PK114_00190 [Smithellaceae bacterium]|nr:hypothetical protein [Smithellaceae bacterium]